MPITPRSIRRSVRSRSRSLGVRRFGRFSRRLPTVQKRRSGIFEREPKREVIRSKKACLSSAPVCFSCQVRFIEILSIRLALGAVRSARCSSLAIHPGRPSHAFCLPPPFLVIYPPFMRALETLAVPKEKKKKEHQHRETSPPNGCRIDSNRD